ncbi:MAG: FkbM family methyltransferase, partial [Prosthecobacter sp.]|nr:FkbM family methyltransferase [Prosthecobacter sp.]
YLRASRMAGRSSVFGDEVAVMLSIASLLPGIDCFVDAGANVGLYSCSIARFQTLFPDLRVEAFEADPDTFERLRRNLAGPKTKAHHVALGSEAGRLRFVRGAVSHVTTTIEQSNAYSLGETFEVECRRLDAFDVRGERLLLKIDVEGQELDVLLGAEEWFDQKRCVAVYLDGFEHPEEVCKFLTRYGFEFFDGRTLKSAGKDTFSLLALQREWLATLRNRLPHEPRRHHPAGADLE